MINGIDPIKSAVTSIVSAGFGTFTNYCTAFAPLSFISLQTANTFFQHLAWTVAICAGIVVSLTAFASGNSNEKIKPYEKSISNPPQNYMVWRDSFRVTIVLGILLKMEQVVITALGGITFIIGGYQASEGYTKAKFIQNNNQKQEEL